MTSLGIAYVRRNLVLFSILSLMIIILADTLLIRYYDLIDKQFIPLTTKKILFAAIAFSAVILQLTVNYYVSNLSKNRKFGTMEKFRSLNRIFKFSLYSLIVVFSFITLEIFYLNYYHVALLTLVVLITYGVGSIFIVRTLILFVSWFRLKRRFVFLLYILSMSMILFNLSTSAIVVTIGLDLRPTEIKEFGGGTMNIFGGKYVIFANLFKLSAVLSFVSIWITTMVLMHDSRDPIMGKILYMVILTIPLIYFLVSYFARDILSPILIPYLRSDPILISMLFTLIFILSKPIGGVIFGVLYWRISRLVSFDKVLRGSMVISGYGFLLMLSANQSSSLVLAPYPPFGAVTITVLIMATYFILVGIYRSAIMVSGNVEIRESIYQITKKANLLDIIGRSEMEKTIENTVTKITKMSFDSETETPKFDLDEKELKGYVGKVIDYLNKK